MWTAGFKTDPGIFASAQQRYAGKPVTVQSCSISSEIDGALRITTSVGDERGVDVSVSITLDELVAWFPEVIEKARAWAGEGGRLEHRRALRATTAARSGTDGGAES